MNNKQELWKQSTAYIFWGVLAYEVLGIVSGIVASVESASNLMSLLRGGGGSPSIGTILCSIGVIAGYVFFFLGIMKFSGAVDEKDVPYINKIKKAVICALCGAAFGMIPAFGAIIGWIFNLVAQILFLIAYNNLRKSTTFPSLEGAQKLFVASVLSLVGACLSFIPAVNPILSFISMIFMLIGWNKIRTAELPADAAPAAETPAVETPAVESAESK